MSIVHNDGLEDKAILPSGILVTLLVSLDFKSNTINVKNKFLTPLTLHAYLFS